MVENCGVTIPIKAKQKGQFLKRQLLVKSDGIVPPCCKTMTLLFPVPLLDDRDFLFYLTIRTNLTLYIHIVDHKTLKVLVKNMSDQLLRISHWQKLGYIIDICYDNCFLANAKAVF